MPVADILLRRQEPIAALTAEEVRRMVELGRQLGRERDALLIWICFETGARITEALALRPIDLDPEQGGIYLINRKRKLRSGQKPPTKLAVCSPRLMAELQRYIAERAIPPDAPVFSSPRRGAYRPLSRVQAWRVVKKLAELAGATRMGRFNRIVPAWPHTLRHGCAVHLVLQSVPTPAIQEQLGHASLSSTQVYVRLTAKQRRELLAGVRWIA